MTSAERLRSMARAKWIIHTTGRHRESIASIGSQSVVRELQKRFSYSSIEHDLESAPVSHGIVN